MHSDPLAPVLLMLMIILAAAKICGEISERLGQPSVLGELLAGILLGNIVLLNPDWTLFESLRESTMSAEPAVIVDALARLGVILLLFEVGLESTVAEMRNVGKASLWVAAAGVIAPFILGFGASWLFIAEVPADIARLVPTDFGVINIHIFIGATLCATSVGITARVFKDLGKLQIREAKIILGAAVIDDVLGLIILAAVSAIVASAMTGAPLSALGLSRIAVISIGFLVLSIYVGVKLIPRIMPYLARFRTEGIMVISALLFCFLLSWLADEVGLAAIVGAFAAGLILEEVHFRDFRERISLHELIRPITTLFVPIFFVLMGIRVRLEMFASLQVLGLAAALTVAAIVGKQICGLAVKEKGLDRISIGVGMIPRGEVGLIFAGIGKSLNVVDDALFSAIVIMVTLTTFAAPPVLRWSIGRWERNQSAAKD
jgi:Kef-type K+ transport system membrane component KefB